MILGSHPAVQTIEVFTNNQLELLERYCVEYKFLSDLIVDGKRHRQEAEVLLNDFPFYEEFAHSLKAKAEQYFAVELKAVNFLFKYEAGDGIPWHLDTSRHYLVSLLYLGKCKGGAFKYKLNDRVNEIKPLHGSHLVTVPKRKNGECVNLLHKVQPVYQGIRWVIATSLIRENKSKSVISRPHQDLYHPSSK